MNRALVLACASSLSVVLGCGSASSPPAAAPPVADAGPAATKEDSPAAASGAAEAPRPFAKTGAEATQYIDDAVEKRRTAIEDCVQDARKRRNDPRAKIEFDIGIDQEGALIGVKAPKGGKDDAVLNECVRKALKGAPFPRSNAGVITVRKQFVDAVVYPK